ncbi:hypothetical protein D4764_17G0008350 [Takifugu flavidus]|uniref:Sterile alpha motif domain-containing protein 3 n=1 Tax=Takifugu flavidus TaxID=433684 RepID=A0A5C6NV33_9TELE|nr:hypothetical protein D4764_17G0008350 [Takifugu flavidus]
MECYKLRVIRTEQDIQKVSLDEKPETVEELKTKIKEKCELQYGFSVMCEDPDFDNALCNLEDIGDLPAARATVKVIPLVVTATTSSTSDASCASDDTEILSSPSSTSSMRQEPRPEFFDIPNFSVDVEFRLRQANLAYLRDKTHWNPPKDAKHGILEKLAETIYKDGPDLPIAEKRDCKGRTSSENFEGAVARSERQVYPEFNREVTKNLQGDLFEALDRHTPRLVEIFRAKKGSVGQTLAGLVQQVHAGNPDVTAMRTMVLRGLPVLLGDDPSDFYNTCFVSYIMSLLKEHTQLWGERRERGGEEKTRRGAEQSSRRWGDEKEMRRGDEREEKERGRGERDEREEKERRKRGLPEPALAKSSVIEEGFTPRLKCRACVCLSDPWRELIPQSLIVLVFLYCTRLEGSVGRTVEMDCDSDETWAQVSVGVLTVVPEDEQLVPNQLHLQPISTAIIVEGAIVMDDVQNLPEALCLLFGLSYALHLDYPNAMKNTFGFIQRVMLGLGESELPPKLHSLETLLLS